MITDGKSSSNSLTLTNAQKVKDEEIHMVAIGIRNGNHALNKAELLGIAGDNEEHVYEVTKGFPDLHNFKELITTTTCQSKLILFIDW